MRNFWLFFYASLLGMATQIAPAWASELVPLVAAIQAEEFHQDIAVLSGLEPSRPAGLLITDRYTKANLALTRDYIAGELRASGFGSVKRQPIFVRTRWANGMNLSVEILGHTKPEEVILVGAHYDSRHASHPGANDNATGVAGVLAAARAFQRQGIRPARTVRFTFFDPEETDLMRGSGGFFKRAEATGEKIELFINMDMIGYSPGGKRRAYYDSGKD